MNLRKILTLSLCLSGMLMVFTPATSQDEETTEQSAEEAGWKSVQMPYTDKNIQVPREVWQQIKATLRDDGVQEAELEDFAVLPVAVQIELFSEDTRVLRDGLNHRVTFIEGGGSLDLFDYVTAKGEFNMRLAPQLNSDSTVHLLYTSDSPGKRVSGKDWGNGCGKMFDLTDNLDMFVYDVGMSVTSSRRHYLHLMAGTFFFFQLVDERLFIGYIRLLDSRYPSFNCRNA